MIRWYRLESGFKTLLWWGHSCDWRSGPQRCTGKNTGFGIQGPRFQIQLSYKFMWPFCTSLWFFPSDTGLGHELSSVIVKGFTTYRFHPWFTLMSSNGMLANETKIDFIGEGTKSHDFSLLQARCQQQNSISSPIGWYFSLRYCRDYVSVGPPQFLQLGDFSMYLLIQRPLIISGH